MEENERRNEIYVNKAGGRVRRKEGVDEKRKEKKRREKRNFIMIFIII